MVKTQPDARAHRAAVVRISDPGMEWHEVDLNHLLACCRRELGFRQRVYPRMVANGKLTEEKATKEIELMRSVVEFLVHCVFKAVTRQPPPTMSAALREKYLAPAPAADHEDDDG